MLTIARLREVLNYDPETGVFTWLKTLARRAPAGSEAGTIAGVRRPYLRITIANEHFHASRLAWFHVHGVWPQQLIDHCDGDPLNNRFRNLREASDSQNQANRRLNKNSTSGFKGVYFDKSSGRWAANILKDRRKLWLGCHDTPQAAHEAYKQAAERLYGEFARFN
jgi:hypothetical protein